MDRNEIIYWMGVHDAVTKQSLTNIENNLGNKLRELSNETGLPCRDCEKALFRKHQDRSYIISKQKILGWYIAKSTYYEEKIKKLKKRNIKYRIQKFSCVYSSSSSSSSSLFIVR